MTGTEKEAVLRQYAAGDLGTRHTIETIGAHDFADLIMVMAQAGLDFPKPRRTAAHDTQVARARAILQPRLRHAG